MRAPRTLFFALLLAVLVTGAAWAQTNDQSTAPPPANAPGPHRMGGMHDGQRGFERMAQELNLTDQQKTQIQNIFQTQRQQAQAIRQDASLTPEQRQDKLKQLRESTHQQITGVLTPEQQQKFQQLRAQHQGMGRGRMGRGEAGPGGMGPLARLNLTSDQKAKIQPILQSQHQQVQAVRQDSSLTPEQKQAKIRDIRKTTRTQIDALLTPDQQQQLQQMWQHRGPHGQQGPPPSPPSGL